MNWLPSAAALILLVFGMTFATGWAFFLLPASRERRYQGLVLGFGLSIVILTLVMQVLMLAHALSLWLVALICGVIGIAGWVLWVVKGDRAKAAHAEDDSAGARALRIAALAAVGVTLAVLTVRCMFYPFTSWDCLCQYYGVAKHLFAEPVITPTLSAGRPGRPLLVPLTYLYAFLCAGYVDQHLGKLVVALFSVMTVLATAELARIWFGRRAAYVSAFAVTFTPLFSAWADSGNVDIPLAFFLVGFVLCLSLTRQATGPKPAVLAGLMLTGALLTKEGAFAIFPFLAATVILVRLGVLGGPRRWPSLPASVWMFGPPLLLAMPWYLRNYLYLGHWLSTSGGEVEDVMAAETRKLWVFVDYHATSYGRLLAAYVMALAAATVAIVPAARRRVVMSWPALAATLGLLTLGSSIYRAIVHGGERPQWWAAFGIAAIVSVVRASRIRLRLSHVDRLEGVVLALIFVLLWYGVWMYRFFYEDRFLVTALPFFAALVGWLSTTLEFERRPHRLPDLALKYALVAVTLIWLAEPAFRVHSGGRTFVRHLRRRPALTDEDKLAWALGDSYAVVRYLQPRLAERDEPQVLSMDGRHIALLPNGSCKSTYPPLALPELAPYEWFVAFTTWAEDWYAHKPGGQAGLQLLAQLRSGQAGFQLMYENPSFQVFRRIHRSDREADR